MEIKHGQLKKLIKAGYKAKVPLDVKGQPGIGKSEVIFQQAKEIAKEENREFVFWNDLDLDDKLKLQEEGIESKFIFADIRLSQFDQTDLKGFPVTDKGFAYWVPPLLFSVLSNNNAKGLVFFDELNLASPSVVASSYQIINDSKIGEMPISKGVYMISAGNGIEDTNNAFEDPAPLNNRRMNVVLGAPDVGQSDGNGWDDWAGKNGVDARIIGYHLSTSGVNLQKFDNNSKDPSFPSPRTWKKLSDMTKDSDDYNYIDLVGQAIIGPFIKEYVAFIKLSEKVDIKDLLANPKKIEKLFDPQKISLLYSVISSVAQLYQKDNTILNDVLKLTHYVPPEYGMFLLKSCKTLSKSDNEFRDLIQTCSEWVKVAPKYVKFLL